MGETGLRAEAVRDAFGALARTLKRISIYRHARAQHASYLEPALGLLRGVLERDSSITLQVTATALECDGEAIYSEAPREWGLCFRLHRDGVRTLSFRRGLTLDELLVFCSVALYDPQRGPGAGREDAVTELWKADLRNIGYTAVSGYRMEHGEADAAFVAAATAHTMAAARSVLLASSAGTSSFADETSMDGRARLLDERGLRALDPEHWPQLALRASRTLLRIVEQGFAGRDVEALEESYWRLLDEMIEVGEQGALASALEALQRMGGTHAALFREAVGLRLSDPQRLASLCELAAASERAQQLILPVWLPLLPRAAGPNLIAALKSAPNSMLGALARAAVERAEACLPELEKALASSTPAAAVALLSALDALAPATRAELAVPALSHPAARVRIAAAAAVAVDPATAVRALPALLNTPDSSVRIAAATALGTCAAMAETAAALLIGALEQGPLSTAGRDELGLCYRALGRLGSNAGFGFLCERLDAERGLFKKKAFAADRLLAVQGLGEENSPRTLRVLDEAGSSNGQPPAVAAAARTQALRLRTSRGGRT